jgi:hypothetical protein
MLPGCGATEILDEVYGELTTCAVAKPWVPTENSRAVSAGVAEVVIGATVT